MSDDDLAVARVGLMAALADADSGLAYRLVLDLMADGVPMATVIDEVLAPIQREAGQRWEDGEVSISEEHAATAAIETLVAMLAGAFEQPVDADLVVVACAEGETHTLPARMAAALLAYEGYHTVFLGTSVPAEDLAEYLQAADASALVVSCTRAANLLGARACVAAAHRAGVPVVVGGRAFGDDDQIATRIGADAHVARLPHLLEVLASWDPDPVASEGIALQVPAEVDALVGERASVAASLRAAVAQAPIADPVSSKVLEQSAEELVDTLAASRYLDDARVLAAHARWVSGLAGRRGGSSVDPEQVLAALAQATEAHAPSVAAFAAAAADAHA